MICFGWCVCVCVCVCAGESVAIALALVGGQPVKEGTGRIVNFELVPLKTLGRPRVDVLGTYDDVMED